MKQYLFFGSITTLVVMVMIVGAQRWLPDESVDSQNGVEQAALDAEAAEVTAFTFASLVTEFVSIANERRAEELLDYLSANTRADVQSDDFVAGVQQLLDVESIVPGSEARIMDVTVEEPEQRAVVQVIFQYPDAEGGVRYTYTMTTSDNRWLVDTITADESERLEDTPPTPPQHNPPSPPPDSSSEPSAPSEAEETDETVSSCNIGGCSGQVCSDRPPEDIVTTCEWREEYACYREATCERQADGECGWTETPELQECLATAGDGAHQ